MKSIFIAGHKGMVGSAITNRLRSEDVELITKDREDLDLLSQADVHNFFSENHIDEMYICAAKVGGINSNNTFRADFIYQNLQIQNNLIKSAHEFKLKKILFLGSSCIYPKMSPQPILEKYLLTSELEQTNKSYALAKIAGLQMCLDFNYQYQTDFRVVMPTNLYGKNDNYDLLNSHVLPALIKKVHLCKVENKKELEIWGTGKAKREFLNACDLAEACIHIMNLDKKLYEEISGKEGFINIGTGNEISIAELAKIICKVVGVELEFKFNQNFPDGTPRKVLDCTKINQSGWSPKINLESGIIDVYKDFLSNNEN